MENSTNKRTSKCREWERNRRNRFNEAIIKLGEVVKKMLKNDPQSDVSVGDNVQYPKIEIIQKAILCLTTCAQEQTQLKAEVLALQVKLEAVKKPDKKDASIQVSAMLCKKNKNGKYVKLVMLQKSKRKSFKGKTSNIKKSSVEDKNQNESSQTEVSPKNNIQKMPKLLPLPNSNTKKGMENTIVMLPSAPYISFPQRPILFPTIPPAIVFLDPNLQTINKPAAIPVLNRHNGDMTKTTTVNILPISAYSGPLSATKPKKNNVKTKQNGPRKVVKKNSKPEVCKESIVAKDLNILVNDKNKNTAEEIIAKETTETEKRIIDIEAMDESTFSKTNTICSSVKDISENKQQDANNDNKTEHPKTSEKNSSNSSLPISSTISKKCNEVQNIEMAENEGNCPKPVKICSEKDLLLVDKEKENKLPHILETALCDNVVDGGNARLELAEEFLAASPTAAFLMSFPLVSGNRSDSPAEEHHNIQSNPKDSNPKRNEDALSQPPFFSKANDVKPKPTKVSQNIPNIVQKQTENEKFIATANVSKELETKIPTLITNTSTENPFLNLPSIIPSTCALTDPAFSLEFDCNITKANQLITIPSSNNFFYKNDPLNADKSAIYSTSNISSGHEFNSIGLYPCAMEKFTGKNKSDFANMEDSLMKIGPSRLTYDIDLGWSHKGFDFVTCTTTSSTYNKDNILSTAPTQYSTSYNPFNPEFHVPLVANTNKKDNIPAKTTTSFPETLNFQKHFYSQANLWLEDMTLYSSNNFSKNLTSKQQNLVSVDHSHKNMNLNGNAVKQYETKIDSATNHMNKSIIEGPTNVTEKYTKKSPSKMHINWMTSEIRPMQNNCNTSQINVKENYKSLYSQNNIPTKKSGQTEGNYFPINMHNFPSQVTQEDFQVWPTARPAGTTEISIEPPPINLPTLVGDLALGPHDRKKNDAINKVQPQTDLQNCNNFFSVTQLMNRSSDAMPPRYPGSNIEIQKTNQNKQNTLNIITDHKWKVNCLDTQPTQPYYVFNEAKPSNFEPMTHFTQSKQKNNKPDKNAKNTKTSYTAEALIRSGPYNQKPQDTNIPKFALTSQKFNDFNAPQDNSVAQVSHFPPLLEYPDNSYTGQQFSGTTLYNSTTNTISNSFYSNFMPGSTNLMTSNYPSAPFQSDFIDYNQQSECNYSNFKYEDLKMKASTAPSLQDKPLPSQYKGRRDAASTKHKLECSKKESNKKCNSKRAKLSNEVEEWSDTAHLLWQNKTPTKRHPNMTDDLSFHNYVGNQISTSSQYQPEFFNTHLMPSNMQNVGHNMDHTLTSSFPPTSRANFNLSTIFPEITMKVQ